MKFMRLDLLLGRNIFKRYNIPFNKKNFDITDKIVEKSVYDTLMPSNLLLDVEGDYKRDKVFYERGKTK